MTVEQRIEAIENTLSRLGLSPYSDSSLSASFYPMKYTGEEIDALLDKVKEMTQS